MAHPTMIMKDVESEIKKLPKSEDDIEVKITPQLQKILLDAENIMNELGDSYVTTEHLLISLVKHNAPSRSILEKH